jgi:hypothetical protein
MFCMRAVLTNKWSIPANEFAPTQSKNPAFAGLITRVGGFCSCVGANSFAKVSDVHNPMGVCQSSKTGIIWERRRRFLAFGSE